MTDGAKLRWLLGLGRPRPVVIGAAIGLSLLEVASSLLFPVLTRNLIDNLTTRFGGATITRDVIILVAVILIGAAAASVSGYLLARSAQKIGQVLKERVFASLLQKPVAFYDEAETGDLVSRITNDSQVIGLLGTKYLAGAVNGLLLLLGSAAVLYMLDRALTLVILAATGAAFLLMAPSILKVTHIAKEINATRARVSASITRALSEIRLIKAMSAEDLEQEVIRQHLANAFAANLRFARVEALLSPLNALALTGAMIVILGYGAVRVAEGSTTIGTLTVFVLYIFNFVAPLIQISTFATQLQSALGSSGHLFGLAAGDEREDREASTLVGQEARVKMGGGVSFENVRFSYPTRAGTALTIDYLEFPRGSSTAIVGASGSGKTTLIALLERFYELEEGRITYDGADVSQLEVREWRRKIGYVPQSAPLLSGTISENIRYGCAEPEDRSRVVEAARASNCLEFISALEHGFDTPVGEAGILLSAGQRQRIALARMFFRDPEIIVLDEATANLDAVNEALVLDSLATLLKGRTSIIITHRSRALEIVDRIVVLERGSVVGIHRSGEALEHTANIASAA